jgi:5-methylcytosine-specific restriction endonuclease McrA
MKNYTATYLKHFKLTTADFIACEVCESKAVDIHHIEARSIAKQKENEIENLMALCRICHVLYGDKKQHKNFLIEIHRKHIKANGPK